MGRRGQTGVKAGVRIKAKTGAKTGAKTEAKAKTNAKIKARRTTRAGSGGATRRRRRGGAGAALARLKHDLGAAVEQQKATAEVLRLISSSSGDLQPVFATILANAVRLCEADNGIINRWDGEALHLVASRNLPAEFVALRERAPYRPNEHSASGRMLSARTVIHIPDLSADQSYIEGNPPTVVVVERAGVRTTLAVPMFKEDELVGSFTVGRTAVRPFTQKQIEVATGFADQAVIAIENARLLQELRESLEQQSATGDVLNIISRSTFDLQEVLDTLIELAAQLCDAELAALHRLHGDNYRVIATYGGPPEHKALASGVPFEAGRGSVIGRTVSERRPVHVADVLAEPDYGLQDAQRRLGYRTVLGVPLLREGNPIGVLVLMRLSVRPFSDKLIALVRNFAAQAVIAIENTRLLSDLRERTGELGRSLAELQRERGNKLMNLEAMAAAISHEVRQPLAGIASNGGAARRFLAHTPPNLDEARLALDAMIGDSLRASQVFDNIRALFGKADQGHAPLDIKELAQGVLDTLRGELDRHGIAMRAALAPDLPPVVGHRGQLQEVLINLVRNAIEAMDGIAGERRLAVTARRHDGKSVAVAIEDTGPGVDPAQIETIFDAFITTKAHGMGLGLALCRMIVERHAGELSVTPAKPRGSIFRLVLPAAPAAT